MKIDVNYHCDDCEYYNNNRELGYYERQTDFLNFTQAVDHLKEYPDHHINAFVEDGKIDSDEHDKIIDSINPLGQD